VAIKEDYQDLYNELITLGKTSEEALAYIEELQIKEEVHYGEDGAKIGDGVIIRIQYSKDDILAVYPNWDNFPETQKKHVLWGIGLDTQKHRYFEEDRIHNNARGDRVFGTVIYGSERTDKEWRFKLDNRGKSVASEEAKSYHRMKDPGFREEIRKLSGR